ncbi:MAG: hypothetical protein ACKVP0_26880 [Pirellulaceae bacterium]
MLQTVGDLRRTYRDCVAKIGHETKGMLIRWLFPDGASACNSLSGELADFEEDGAPDDEPLSCKPNLANQESRYIRKEMPIVKITIDWGDREVICHCGEPV